MALLHFCTPPRVRVRATVKLSAAFFHDESSITKAKKGVIRKCNSTEFFYLTLSYNFGVTANSQGKPSVRIASLLKIYSPY